MSPSATLYVGTGPLTVSLSGTSDGFRGAFILDVPEADAGVGTSQFLPTTIAESLPYTPRVAHGGVMEARAYVEGYVQAAGFTIDRSRAEASIFPFDCQLTPGAALQVDVSGGDASTKVVYWVSGLPSLDADRTTPLAGDGLNAVFVPPNGIELVARDADSRAVVASYRYRPAPDTYLFLHLYPQSSEDCLP